MTSTTASTSVDETTPILNEQNGMAGFLVRLFVNIHARMHAIF